MPCNLFFPMVKKIYIPKSFAPYYEVTPQCLLLTVRFLSAFIVLEQQAIDVAPNLMSKDSRREWEAMFNTSVVTPVLTVCPFPPSPPFLVYYILFQLFIIFMCFKMFNDHFFKNLEEKIQRCLGLLVGDNRLGKLNFLVTFMTRQIKSQFNSPF